MKIARVTLHVGLGTFRPVKVDNVLEHKMHEEYYEISKQDVEIINSAKEKEIGFLQLEQRVSEL